MKNPVLYCKNFNRCGEALYVSSSRYFTLDVRVSKVPNSQTYTFSIDGNSKGLRSLTSCESWKEAAQYLKAEMKEVTKDRFKALLKEFKED